MESALRNLSSSVELLAVAAHSGAVDQWNDHSLSTAFDWARYCEHLFSRFHNNPAVRGAMEEQLQLTNGRLRAAFPGSTEVSFHDLSRCQHHLLIGLLNNPKLPLSIMKLLFDSNAPADSGCVDVAGLCSRILQCKSACKVLSPLTPPSAVGAEAEVQGGLLMERLGALITHGGAEHFLDSVLRGREEAAAEHFCLVIAAALLTRTNSETASHEVLLDWLLKKQPSTLERMCSALPTALLKDLVREHLKYRDAYRDVLTKWASEMEYSISDGEWVQSRTNPPASFQKLTEHFQALFETCPSLRDDVEKELNALKISDGDFDVRGLSVWGDLLSELHK
ncbi:Fanconi anemia group F protein [Platichthys flesus]|uniref:Fanconi anemia group F protein n=1 Tax=Platichthys flesus TaxID=8260 RepID=UPI002DBC30E0|nr:Fanconi anemia group F protein [Platichthys flesus]